MSRPVALVTGASRGIGRAIALALSPTHHVLVGGRDTDAVADVVRELESAEPFIADLTNEAAVTAAIAGIDRLDVLVHSAGASGLRPADRLHHGTVARADGTERDRAGHPHPAAAAGAAGRARSGHLPQLRRRAHRAPWLRRLRSVEVRADRTGRRPARRRAGTGAGHLASTPDESPPTCRHGSPHSKGMPYIPDAHLDPDDVARGVRLAVDLPPDASLDALRINPV